MEGWALRGGGRIHVRAEETVLEGFKYLISRRCVYAVYLYLGRDRFCQCLAAV